MISTVPLPASLSTDRLVMRPATMDDLPFLTELHLDPEVTRFLGGDGSPRPPEASLDWLEKTLGWYRDENVGQFIVLADGKPIGRSGFGLFEIEVEPDAEGSLAATWGRGSAAPGRPIDTVLEVGYSFQRSAWGSGFATEAAAAWYAFAFGDYGVDHVGSIIHLDNIGSRRVAEKNGLAPRSELLLMEGRHYQLFEKRKT